MTTTFPAARSAATRGVSKSVIAATVAGNAIEFYDFISFAFFAVYISGAFFPPGDDFANLLKTLAVFWAGFIFRPLGGIVIGGRAGRSAGAAAQTSARDRVRDRLCDRRLDIWRLDPARDHLVDRRHGQSDFARVVRHRHQPHHDRRDVRAAGDEAPFDRLNGWGRELARKARERRLDNHGARFLSKMAGLGEFERRRAVANCIAQ